MNSALIVYINMDNVLANYSLHFNEKIFDMMSMSFPRSHFGFYLDIPPMDGAIEGVKTLMADENIEPYIVATQSINNPKYYPENNDLD